MKSLTQFFAAVWLAFAVQPAMAAPALKPETADGKLDAEALHKLIASAAASGKFAERDLNNLKAFLTKLHERLDAIDNRPADMAKNRKLPAALQNARSAEVEDKVELIQKNELLRVGKSGRMVQCKDSVLFVSGDATVIQCRFCVIIAGGDVRLAQSNDCLVIAGGSIDMGQCLPRKPEPKQTQEPLGTIAIAGRGLKCSQSGAAIAFVLSPDRSKNELPIRSSQNRDILFLNAEGDRKSIQDKECRDEPLKTPLLK